MAFTVPGYRVERLLGVGSQAEVWLGEHRATGERVALKRIAAGSAAATAAGRAEAALLAALDHPHLIALRACLPLDPGLVLVLELAEAGTLAALLARRRRLTPPEVVAAISPIAAALAHAHEAGLLHGDVSAANILFTRAGRPKLADLGVARLLVAIAGPRPAPARDGAGQSPADAFDALGTPAYLDPTIAAGGAAGLASDVFSLGAVALHALTGAGPWQAPGEPAPSAEDAVAVAATGTIAGLAERLAAVPPAMAEVLIRALDPAPHRRGTAAELALDLRASLPPARLELAGGRIARSAGQWPAGDVPAGQLLEAVPIDLTRIAPARPPTDIAAMLRAGGADPLPEVARLPARWARVRAAGARCRTRLAAPRRGRLAIPVWLAARRSRLATRWRSRPVGRHRAAATAAGRSGAALRRMVAVLLAAGVLAAGCVLGWPQAHHPDASQVLGLAGQARPANGQARPAAGQAAPSAGQDSADLRTAADASRVLAELAAVRERAYAQRRPELLAGVYASAALLAADTEQLYRSVPAGCGLSGVRTGYADCAWNRGRARVAGLRWRSPLPHPCPRRCSAARLRCAARLSPPARSRRNQPIPSRRSQPILSGRSQPARSGSGWYWPTSAPAG